MQMLILGEGSFSDEVCEEKHGMECVNDKKYE